MNQSFKPKEINKIMLEFLVSSVAYGLSVILSSLPTIMPFISSKIMLNTEASVNTFAYLFMFASILKPIALIVFIKFLYDFIKNILIAISLYINKNINQ